MHVNSNLYYRYVMLTLRRSTVGYVCRHAGVRYVKYI